MRSSGDNRIAQGEKQKEGSVANGHLEGGTIDSHRIDEGDQSQHHYVLSQHFPIVEIGSKVAY